MFFNVLGTFAPLINPERKIRCAQVVKYSLAALMFYFLSSRVLQVHCGQHSLYKQRKGVGLT
jgi:hypothetical protein